MRSKLCMTLALQIDINVEQLGLSCGANSTTSPAISFTAMYEVKNTYTQ